MLATKISKAVLSNMMWILHNHQSVVQRFDRQLQQGPRLRATRCETLTENEIVNKWFDSYCKFACSLFHICQLYIWNPVQHRWYLVSLFLKNFHLVLPTTKAPEANRAEILIWLVFGNFGRFFFVYRLKRHKYVCSHLLTFFGYDFWFWVFKSFLFLWRFTIFLFFFRGGWLSRFGVAFRRNVTMFGCCGRSDGRERGLGAMVEPNQSHPTLYPDINFYIFVLLF